MTSARTERSDGDMMTELSAHPTGDTVNRPTGIQTYRMFVDGQWLSADDGATFGCVDPFNREEWARVPSAGATDVDRAVQAARRAFTSGPWSNALPADRAALLRRLGDGIKQHSESLAAVQVRENGKVLRELRGQAELLSKHCYFYAGLAETLHGTTVPVSVPDMFHYTVRQPVGVVAAVTPWNSPLLLMLWKLGPALAAGNTVVIKPSEISPVSTLEFARIVDEAGIPPGVVNVVTGAGKTGGLLIGHADVDRIAFTGSTATGKQIAAAAAGRLARVSLELGGKSPNIVFEDADLEDAILGVLAGIFGATGQTCMAGSRVLVQGNIYQEFIERLVERVRRIRVGDPFDAETEVGTVAFEGQYEKVLRYIEIGQAEGAKLLFGGGRPDDASLSNGLFVLPTVFADVTNDMRIAREEIFGPVASVIRFESEDEAVAIANDTPFGLAAGVWTKDIGRAHRMTHRLRAGTVWVNVYRRTNYAAPFGGFKESGLGRENGIEALHEYTELKSVWINTGGSIKDPFNPRA